MRASVVTELVAQPVDHFIGDELSSTRKRLDAEDSREFFVTACGDLIALAQPPASQLGEHLSGCLPLPVCQLLCRLEDVVRNVEGGSHTSDATASNARRQRLDLKLE